MNEIEWRNFMAYQIDQLQVPRNQGQPGQPIIQSRPYQVNQYPSPLPAPHMYKSVYAPFIPTNTAQYRNNPEVNPANQMIQERVVNQPIYPFPNNSVNSVVVLNNPTYNPGHQTPQVPLSNPMLLPNQNSFIPGISQTVLNANCNFENNGRMSVNNQSQRFHAQTSSPPVLNVHAPPYNYYGRYANIQSNQRNQTQAQNAPIISAPLVLEDSAHFQENNEIDLHRNDGAYSVQSHGQNIDQRTVEIDNREIVAPSSSNVVDTANRIDITSDSDDDEAVVAAFMNIIFNDDDDNLPQKIHQRCEKFISRENERYIESVSAALTEHQTGTRPSNVRDNVTNNSESITSSEENQQKNVAHNISDQKSKKSLDRKKKYQLIKNITFQFLKERIVKYQTQLSMVEEMLVRAIQEDENDFNYYLYSTDHPNSDDTDSEYGNDYERIRMHS